MCTKWMYVRLFYSNEANEFILYRVFSIVEELCELNLVGIYFYVRYNDPEPHIRLRFTLPDDRRHEALDVIRRHAGTQFSEEIYEPEIDRYGSGAFMEIAETHFCHSSQTCMKLLQADGHSILVDGIQMHLALLHSFGFSTDETIILFTAYMNRWIKYSLSNNEVTQTGSLLKKFEALFSNDPRTAHVIAEYWKDLSDEKGERAEWLTEWIMNNRSIFRSITELRKTAEMSIANIFMVGYEEEHLSGKKELFSFCESLIHMTNNRLGIPNQDESYVAFIIKESLRTAEWKGTFPFANK